MNRLTVILVIMLTTGVVHAQNTDFDTVEIKTTQLAGNLYMLEGSGGNIGVSVGEDGVFLIDSQFAELTDKIINAVAAITDEPIRYVLNTHHHPDHTGGNENLAAHDVIILSHENARKYMAEGNFNVVTQRELPPLPESALPVISFNESLSLHINGENIRAFHVDPAHTDGDAFVYFPDANVIHVGDVFRTTSYPLVDAGANGSFRGIMAAYKRLIDLAGPGTKILPGHGVLSTREDVQQQLAMFETILNRVQGHIEEGRSLEEVIAATPTAEFDQRWGSGRVTGADITTVIYNELNSD